jgi:hypothetical protein
MKKQIMTIALIAGCGMGLLAQKNAGFLLQAGEDAKVLTQAYLRPYGEMLGNNLNGGWYTSAAPHKVLGFNVTLMGSYTMAPTSAETFDVSKLGLSQFNVSSSSSIAPTMAGKMNNRPTLAPNVTGGSYAEFTLPNGSGSNVMVSPMLQAGIGLPKGTELIARYMPDTKIGEYGKLGLWGVGVKHSLKDYIPFVKRVPFWNVSVLGAYTNFNSGMAMPDFDENGLTLRNGTLDISSAAFTGRLLIGANFPFIALYTGIGYGTTNTTFEMSGKLNGDDFLMDIPFNGSGSFDTNIGARVRLGVIAIHADYTVGNYSMLTAGLGISFR